MTLKLTSDKAQELADNLQERLDAKRTHADLYDDTDRPYIECTKAVEPVKKILAELSIPIYAEYESSGSDYDSYIIELDIEVVD